MTGEILRSKPVVWATTALTALTISACGESLKNPQEIESCAQAEVPAEILPEWEVPNAQEAEEVVDRAVATVNEHMHQTSTEAADADELSMYGVDEGYLPLAHAIYASDYPWFDISPGEGKLDDISEQLCYGDKKADVFFTPRAEAVIQALVRKGIKLSPGVYRPGWDKVLDSITKYNSWDLSSFDN